MTQLPHQNTQLPPDITRIVTFDTNAYRNLNRNKVGDLKQRERAGGIFALANPIVIQELGAHLADKQDDDYRHCMSALAKLAEHTQSPGQTDGGLCLLPDPQTAVCHQLFRVIPEGRPDIIRGLARLAAHVREHAPHISDSIALTNIALCARFVTSREILFRDRIHRLIARVGKASIEEWGQILSELAVLEHAALIGCKMAEAEVKVKTRTLTEVYPAPLRLIATLLFNEQTQVAVGKKERWGNFFWDYCVCFNAGVLNQVEHVPVYLVSGDGDVLKAAAEANCADRVLSLPEYMKSVGLN